jgi:hypothetical protein
MMKKYQLNADFTKRFTTDICFLLGNENYLVPKPRCKPGARTGVIL